MAPTNTKAGKGGQARAKKAETTKTAETTTKTAENGGTRVVENVRQTAERSVDVPVGVALTFADRVSEFVEPFSSREAASDELDSVRQRVTRQLNRYERRGASARRKATQRVRQTRNRVERELKRRRRSVETTVKENRVRVEDGLKRAQERVSELV